jgi:hypothetical protein
VRASPSGSGVDRRIRGAGELDPRGAAIFGKERLDLSRGASAGRERDQPAQADLGAPANEVDADLARLRAGFQTLYSYFQPCGLRTPTSIFDLQILLPLRPTEQMPAAKPLAPRRI